MNLVIAAILVITAMCNAEPPRFRQFQRQHVNPAWAPYPPSGYRPDKEFGSDTTSTELPSTTTTTISDETETEMPQVESLASGNRGQVRSRPLLLLVPRVQQQAYFNYDVDNYATLEAVQIQANLAPRNEKATILSANGRLETLPVQTIYNPYAYFHIYN